MSRLRTRTSASGASRCRPRPSFCAAIYLKAGLNANRVRLVPNLTGWYLVSNRAQNLTVHTGTKQKRPAALIVYTRPTASTIPDFLTVYTGFGKFYNPHSNAAGLGSARNAKPDIIYPTLGWHGGRAFSPAAFERGSKIDVSGEHLQRVSSFTRAEKTRLQSYRSLVQVCFLEPPAVAM